MPEVFRLKPGTVGLNLRQQPNTAAPIVATLGPSDLLQGLQETADGRWMYGETPKGTGWASVAFLVRETGYKLPFVIPDGLNAIMATYGPPGTKECQQGRANLPRALPLSWAPSQRVTEFACHEKVAPLFTAAFRAVEDAGLWKHLRTFGGCYNYRAKRGASRLSVHSWGAAIDLNPETNGLGVKGDMHPGIVRVFDGFGLVWGGRFKRLDFMHWQAASGY